MARRTKLAIGMADELEFANVRGLKQVAVHVTHDPHAPAVEIAEERRQHPWLKLRIRTKRQVDLVPADGLQTVVGSGLYWFDCDGTRCGSDGWHRQLGR